MKLLLLGSLAVLLVWSSSAFPTDDFLDEEIAEAAARQLNEPPEQPVDEQDECVSECEKDDDMERCIAECLVAKLKGSGKRTTGRKRGLGRRIRRIIRRINWPVVAQIAGGILQTVG